MCFEVYYASSQGKQFILFPGNLSVEILGNRDSLYSQRRNISTCESNTQLAVNIFGNRACIPCDVIDFELLPALRILAGKRFIVRCHVTSKWPTRECAVGKKRSYVTKQFLYTVVTNDKVDTYKSFESWFSSANPCQRQFSPYIY